MIKKNIGLLKNASMIAATFILGSYCSQESQRTDHQALIDAITQKDLAYVQHYVQEHPQAVYAKNRYGKTPLHFAAENGSANIAQVLITAGAHVKAKMFSGATPLWLAVSEADIDIVRILVTNGAEINANTTLDGFATSVHIAATKKNLDIFRYLTDNGANLEISDSNGNTPLHHATRTGNSDVVGFLLSRGHAKDQANAFGETPLYQAAKEGYLPIVQVLVQHGAIFYGHSRSFLPTNGAAAQGHLSVVSFFLAQEPKYIDETDQLGYTALEWAIGHGQLNVVIFLLKNGALIREPKDYSFFSPKKNPIIFADPTIETGEETIEKWQQVLTFLFLYGSPLGTYGTRILQTNPEIRKATEEINLRLLNQLHPCLPRDVQGLILSCVAMVKMQGTKRRNRGASVQPNQSTSQNITVAKKQRSIE